MRRVISRVPAAACLLAAACGDSAGHAALTRADSAGVTIVESVVPSGVARAWALDSTSVVRIGVEQGDEPYQLFRVFSARALADGRILVGNAGTHEVRVYTNAGVYVRAFGRAGEGPGEFGAFSSLRLYPFVGDSVAVTDDANRRLNIFTAEGEFARTVPVRGSPGFGSPGIIGRFDDGRWLAIAPVGSGVLQGAPGERIDMDLAYLVVTAAGDSLRSIATHASRPRVVNQLGEVRHYPYVPLTADPSATVDGSTLLLGPGDRAEVHRVSMDGRLAAVYRWHAPRRPVADVWDRYVAAFLEDIEDENQRRLYARLFQRDLPVPEYLPVVRAVEVDALGYVWAERFRLPWERAVDWDVLTPDGEWLGTFSTPAGLRVLEIGESHLLGRHVDELGVERVLRYGLSRGGGRMD